MTVRDYRALEGLDLVPFDVEFDLARAVKSEAELESVRDSVRINEGGFEVFLAAYAPGKTAAEVMAPAEEFFVERGCGRLTMNMVLIGPEFEIAKKETTLGDFVLPSLEVAGPGMHWVEVSRAIGQDADRTIERMLEAYDEYYAAAREAMRAGATAHDVHRAVSKGFTERGYHLGHVTGHSIGMTMIEFPKVGEGVETELAVGDGALDAPARDRRERRGLPLHAGHVARHRRRAACRSHGCRCRSSRASRGRRCRSRRRAPAARRAARSAGTRPGSRARARGASSGGRARARRRRPASRRSCAYLGYRREQGNLMPQTGDLPRRLAVARGDEPADLVVRGGRVLSVFTREWLEVDVAICDGVDRRPRLLRRRRDARRRRRLRRPRLHRRAHASGDVEAASLRVRAPRAAARDDHGRRRPARDRERARHRRRPLARRRLRGASRSTSSSPPPRASPRRTSSRRAAPSRRATSRACSGGSRVIGLAEMMNFPGVISGADSELAKLAVAGDHHVDGHAPGVLGHALQAYAAAGIRSDHEAFTAEEGRERLRAGMWLLIREASAARNLRALAPLVAGVRAVTDGVLHRRPRAGAHRRGRPRQRDRPRRGCARDRAGRRARDGAPITPRSGTGSTRSARSHRATRPTCCCSRTSSASCPRSCSSADARSTTSRATDVPEWVTQSVRIQPVERA